ncbi:MAG: bifunctional riboflavin kinase/FMN adenylyltransferase [Bacteroides sp.]|nr:bifunctional riboflavin kinase/FMN adenylyltransferase [Bacteroides sp.]
MERVNAAAVGMFDGVHLGHLDILDAVGREAARTGGKPVVLTFRNHPLSLLRPQDAPPLLTDAAEKEALIRARLPEATVGMLDFGELRGLPAGDFLKRLRDEAGVATMVMGYDNRFGCDGPRDRAAYDALGARAGMDVVHVAPRPVDGVTASSSRVRELIAAGSVDRAAAMLGRPYSLRGTVVHGRHLGHTLGFPTANVEPAPGRQLPARGVYAAWALLPGEPAQRVPAMVNVGVRPTVDTSPHPALSIEAHLPGFHGDLYGCSLELQLVQRLRGERRFESREALVRQLAIDRHDTLEILSANSPSI